MRLAPFFALAASALVFSAVACGGTSDDSSDDHAVTPQNDDGSGEDELKSLALTDADNGKTVTVTKGQNVLVKLQSNPTTGYKWVVASTDRTFGYPAYDRFVKNGDGAVGSGGLQRLTWKTNSPLNMVGSHHVKLEYRRPWEENASPAKTFEFTVNIVDGSCPELSPPAPGFCKDGQIVPKKDANGCTTGFECKVDCRTQGCGTGKWCSACWGQFACIPNGAMC